MYFAYFSLPLFAVFDDHFSSQSRTDCDLNVTHLSGEGSAKNDCGALTLSSFSLSLFTFHPHNPKIAVALNPPSRVLGRRKERKQYGGGAKPRKGQHNFCRNPMQASTSHWPEKCHMTTCKGGWNAHVL